MAIAEYREQTFRYREVLRLKTAEEAVRFVNKHGFIFFWPVKGILMPSLWGAAAGNRPVPNNHDDPGHITWRWKDDLLNKKKWHYAKILRNRSTIISMDLLPFFYALSPNYGSPEDDLQIGYQDGLITQEQKQIFDALVKKGPLDTINLRKAANLSSRDQTYRFNRALSALQRDFRILPMGISKSGSWNYSFMYELVHRYYPKIIGQGKLISEEDARLKILKYYFNSVGSVPIQMLRKIFMWSKQELQKGINLLLEADFIRRHIVDDLGEHRFTITQLHQSIHQNGKTTK